uniref:Uncharacterized protein LOC105039181 isoform X1 n=1 Tax=Elaeis guineensis var. tenera TaxID=51953 RepID=A0A8N4F1J2_ELAGV|nr:uncharacterized protein LOC105039181 isoform X1 [Elaeis guineensis]XP_029118576.1 uncharacterized protein LOC105039181 isoform X1 [Elaeis guineensis]XP_029118577.1 uncharacterized protein LOC105039181 isoform X1 [Elaeis guineensis]
MGQQKTFIGLHCQVLNKALNLRMCSMQWKCLMQEHWINPFSSRVQRLLSWLAVLASLENNLRVLKNEVALYKNVLFPVLCSACAPCAWHLAFFEACLLGNMLMSFKFKDIYCLNGCIGTSTNHINPTLLSWRSGLVCCCEKPTMAGSKSIFFPLVQDAYLYV